MIGIGCEERWGKIGRQSVAVIRGKEFWAPLEWARPSEDAQGSPAREIFGRLDFPSGSSLKLYGSGEGGEHGRDVRDLSNQAGESLRKSRCWRETRLLFSAKVVNVREASGL